MKKKGTITVEYKHPLHLFRDELLDIEKIFKQDLKGRDFKVSFDDFESEDISSISTDQKASNNLSFNMYDPYFSLDIRQYSSRFYGGEDSLQIRGAIEKIEEIFEKAIHKSSKLRGRIGWIMFGLAVISLSLVWVNLIYDRIEIFKNSLYSLDFLFLLCSISCVQMRTPLKPIIEFEARSKRKNFWEKNKEQIYVGLIIAVPAAILSFLLGRLS